MAESSLSVGYPDLLRAVGTFLDWGGNSANWSETKAAEIDRLVQAGYRQFLYPPAVDGVPAGYEWSFIKPVTTITTAADDEDQDLPDDFGRLVNGFTFAEGAQYAPVLADVGEGRIRELRQSRSESGRPRVAGIRIKSGTGTTGQRKEALWWPTPDAAYVLTYKYEAYTGALSASAPYPLGGMKHAELLIASCLAVAETKVNEERGAQFAAFAGQLAASVARDMKEGAEYFGHIGCRGEYDGSAVKGSFPYTLTVCGTVIQ